MATNKAEMIAITNKISRRVNAFGEESPSKVKLFKQLNKFNIILEITIKDYRNLRLPVNLNIGVIIAKATKPTKSPTKISKEGSNIVEIFLSAESVSSW